MVITNARYIKNKSKKTRFLTEKHLMFFSVARHRGVCIYSQTSFYSLPSRPRYHAEIGKEILVVVIVMKVVLTVTITLVIVEVGVGL